MPLRRPSALVAGLTASVVASLVAALGGIAPAHAVPTDGASGAGDTYFPQDGNGGLDVTHYDIHDRYAVHRQTLRGWTDVTATATQDLSSFDLDLALTPDAVFVNGARASYAKPSVHELRITPATPITAGSSFVVRVRYHGTPRKVGSDGERPFFSYDGEAMATNEPHVAPWWFPSNDHPSDKATYDISVAVATPFKAISNGRLVARTTSGAWRTFHWRMAQPMASYLAFFAAGRFRVERGTSHGRPWYDAVSQWYRRSEQVAALRLLRRTPGYVSWLETQYGPYPFDSTGGLITSIYTGFALENQSRPTYPFLGTGREARITLVHELAHQWFGDKVSVQRWRDIWLNEGFASWTEWRFLETHGGERAQHRLLREYAARPADRAFWRLVIANPGPKRLFNAPVYDRGAMALQALRHRIGTTAFLSLLRTWTEQHAYGNATVEQFEALAEQVSGQDLDAFFTAWLHTGTKPARTVANGLR